MVLIWSTIHKGNSENTKSQKSITLIDEWKQKTLVGFC